MRVLYVSLVIFIADQVSKFFVKGISIPALGINITGMEYGQSIDIIGSFFRLTFVENPGMAFGIDVGDQSKLFLSLFSLVASIGILIYLYRVKNEGFILRFSLALILAGALGNLIDRTFYGLIYDYAPVFYGKVVDFFNVDFWDFTLFGHTYERWPIFNIADTSVTIGVLLLIFFHREKKQEDVEESPNVNEDEPVEEDKKPLENLSEIKEDNDENNNRKEIKV